MMFPERIFSISDTDKVLEVGPGGAPHCRSNVLLEKVFDKETASEQRGHVGAIRTDKEIVFYNGDAFPFSDNEFDYVICSHVLEHVPEEEIESFVSELQRVARNGYLEYPTIYYEYLYNFKVHVTLLNYKDGVIYYMEKNSVNLFEFYAIQKFFYKTLENGYDEIVRENKQYFFQGFEWSEELKVRKAEGIQDLLVTGIEVSPRTQEGHASIMRRFIRKLLK